MKSLLALFLAIVMMLSVATPALALEEDNSSAAQVSDEGKSADEEGGSSDDSANEDGNEAEPGHGTGGSEDGSENGLEGSDGEEPDPEDPEDPEDPDSNVDGDEGNTDGDTKEHEDKDADEEGNSGSNDEDGTPPEEGEDGDETPEEPGEEGEDGEEAPEGPLFEMADFFFLDALTVDAYDSATFINAVKSGYAVNMTSDITLAGNVGAASATGAIQNGVTIYGNGHTLNVGSYVFYLSADSDGTLTIDNLKIEQMGTAKTGNAQDGLFILYASKTSGSGKSVGWWDASFHDFTLRGRSLLGTNNRFNSDYGFKNANFTGTTLIDIVSEWRALNGVIYAENISIDGTFTMTNKDAPVSKADKIYSSSHQYYFASPGGSASGDLEPSVSYSDSASASGASGTFKVEQGAVVNLFRQPGPGTTGDPKATSGVGYFKSLIYGYQNFKFDDSSTFTAKAGANMYYYYFVTDRRSAVIRSDDCHSFVVGANATVDLEVTTPVSAGKNESEGGWTALMLRKAKTTNLEILVETGGKLNITAHNQKNDGGGGSYHGRAPVVIWGLGSSDTTIKGELNVTSQNGDGWYYEYNISTGTYQAGAVKFTVDGGKVDIKANNEYNSSTSGHLEYAAWEAYGSYPVTLTVKGGGTMNVESLGYRAMSLAGGSTSYYPKKVVHVTEDSELKVTGMYWAIAAEHYSDLYITVDDGGKATFKNTGPNVDDGSYSGAGSTIYSVGNATYSVKDRGSELNVISEGSGYGAIFHDTSGSLNITVENYAKMKVENTNTGRYDANRRGAITAQTNSKYTNLITVKDYATLEVINNNPYVHGSGAYLYPTGAIAFAATTTGNVRVSNGANFYARSESRAPTIALRGGSIIFDNPGNFEIRNNSLSTSDTGSYPKYPVYGYAVYNSSGTQDRKYDAKSGNYPMSIKFIDCDVWVWSVYENANGYAAADMDNMWQGVSFEANNLNITTAAGTGLGGDHLKHGYAANQFDLTQYGRINGVGEGSSSGHYAQKINTPQNGTKKVGELVTYTITVGNNSFAPWKGVVVVDQLPAGVEYVAGSASYTGGTLAASDVDYNAADNILTVSLGDIPSTAEYKLTFDVVVLPSAASKSIRNTGYVTDDNGGEEEIDDKDDSKVDGPQISVTKTNNHVGDISAGDNIPYTIIVTNNSDKPVYNVLITDDLPDGVELNTGANDVIRDGNIVLARLTTGPINIGGYMYDEDENTLSVLIGELAAGGTAKITFSAKVLDTAIGNTIPNTGTVTGNSESGGNITNPDFEENFDDGDDRTVMGVGAYVTKTNDIVGVIRVGETPTVTYTITFGNNGNMSWYNPIIEDYLPHTSLGTSVLSYVENSASLTNKAGDIIIAKVEHNWATTNPGGIRYERFLVNHDLNEIKPGEEYTLTFQAEATAPIPSSLLYAPLENTGFLLGKTVDTNSNNDITVAFSDNYNLSVHAALDAEPYVTKSSNRATLNPDGLTHVGDKITYTIEVGNTSAAADWYGATVVDYLSKDVELLKDTLYYTPNAGAPSPTGFPVAYKWDTESNEDYNILTLYLGSQVNTNPPNGATILKNEYGLVTFDVIVLPSAAGKSIRNTGLVTGYDKNADVTDPTKDPDIVEIIDDGDDGKVAAPIIEVKKENDRKDAKLLTKVGDTVEYTITVKNTGNAPLYNAQIIDELPNGVALDDTATVLVNGNSPAAGRVKVIGEGTDKEIIINIDQVNPGEIFVITFTVKVLPEAAGEKIKNIGTITGDYGKPDPLDPKEPGETPDYEDNFNDGDEKVVLTSKLEAVKTSDRNDPTRVGEKVVYTIQVSNLGQTPIYGVKVYDQLPDGVELDYSSVYVGGAKQTQGTGFTVAQDGTLAIKVGTVGLNAKGDDAILVTFAVTVTAAAKGQSIQNVGYVEGSNDPGPSGEGGEPNVKDEFDDGDDSPVLDPLTVDPFVEKTNTRSTTEKTYVGETFEYIIKVGNDGTGTWHRVVITDNLPDGVAYVEGSATVRLGNQILVRTITYDEAYHVLTVNMGDIGPDELYEVRFQVEVLGSALGQSIQNTGTVTGYTDGEDPGEPDIKEDIDDEDDDTVEGAGLEATKTSNRKERTLVGDQVTYTIAVQATGKGALYGVRVIDQIPAGLQLVENSVRVNGTRADYEWNQAGTDLIIHVGTVTAGGDPTLVTFTVEVLESAIGKEIRNVGRVGGSYDKDTDPDEYLPDVEDEFDDENDDKVHGTVIPEVTKVSDRDATKGTKVDDIVEYTIFVTNKGTGTWYDVEVHDYLSAHVELIEDTITVNGLFIDADSDYDYKVGADGLVVYLGDVEAGKEFYVVFSVKVLDSAHGKSIKNIGKVTGSAVDPDIDPDVPPTEEEFDDDDDNIVLMAKPYATKKNDKPASVKIREGDTIRYTIEVGNTGDTAWYDAIVYDTINTYVTLDTSTVEVSGVSLSEKPSGTPLTTGEFSFDGTTLIVPLGTVEPDAVILLTFSVTVNTGAAGNKIRNMGEVTGRTDEDREPDIDIIITDGKDREVEPGNDIKPYVKKTSNRKDINDNGKTYVGDVFTYKIEVGNMGSETWHKVELVDALAEGLKLVENTLKIDGKLLPASRYSYENNVLVVDLQDITTGDTLIITFDVEVMEAAAGTSIRNIGTVLGYSDDDDDGDPDTGNEFDDEDDEKVVGFAVPKVAKETDRDKSKPIAIGDVITYTITAWNEGNGTWYDVKIVDEIQYGVEVLMDTIQISKNGAVIPGGHKMADYDDTLTVRLGDIGVDDTYVLTFSVRVLPLALEVDDIGNPKMETIENKGKATGQIDDPDSYDDDPANLNDGKKDVEEKFTDGDDGTVSAPGFSAVKTSSRDASKGTYVDDVITYTITATTRGAGTIYDAFIQDVLPEGLELVSGSIRKNGWHISSDEFNYVNNVLTIFLGNLDAGKGETVTITFNAVVLPTAYGKSILNAGTVGGYYDEGDDGEHDDNPDIEDSFDDGDENAVLGASKPYADKKSNRRGTTRVGDKVTYTIEVGNTGNESWYNAVVYDSIPEGTELLMETIRHNEQAPSNYVYNAVTRELSVELGEIEPDAVHFVTFDVEVLPSALGLDDIRNMGKVTGNSEEDGDKEEPDIDIDIDDEDEDPIGTEKDPKPYVYKVNDRNATGRPTAVGQTVTYTVHVNNEGTGTWYNVVLEDMLHKHVALVANSVTFDGVSHDYTLRSNNKLIVDLGNIAANSEHTVTFQVTVLDTAVGKSIRNLGVVMGSTEEGGDKDTGKEFDDRDEDKVTGETILKATKVNNRPTDNGTRPNNIITYTITMENTGNAAWFDVIMTDTLPTGVSLVADSVKVDGQDVSNYNLVNRALTVPIGTLRAKQSVEVEFKVTVLSSAVGLSIQNRGYFTGSNTEGGSRYNVSFDDGDTRLVEGGGGGNPGGGGNSGGDPEYTVTYNGNGNTGGAVPVDESTYGSGETVTVLGNTGRLVRNGYTFVGWNTVRDGSGTLYTTGNTFKITKNTTLYAIWEEGDDPEENNGPPYYVYYHDNGATTGVVPVDNNEYNTGDTVTLLYNTGALRRTDFSFNGWGLSPSGGSTLAPGMQITMGTRDIHLYPRWVSGSGGGGGGTSNPGYETIPDMELPLAGLNRVDHVWYIQGFPDNSVRPDGSLTRAEAAAIFYRLTVAADKGMEYTAEFSDVDSSAWYYKEVAYMAAHNIITGYEDGTFRGNAPITRAEFATIASRYDALVLAEENGFSDVSDDHWALIYINSSVAKGWITGYEDSTFRPSNNITRAEAATMINRVLDRKVLLEDVPEGVHSYTDLATTHWAYCEIIEASHEHDFERKTEAGIEEIWTIFTYAQDM